MKHLFFVTIISVLFLQSCSLLSSEKEPIPEIPGKIVFAMPTKNASGEIFTINTDGSGLKRLTNLYGTSFFPYWSSDGSEIVFTSQVYPNLGLGALVLMNSNGKNIRPLKEEENFKDFYMQGYRAKFDQDNSKIVFQSCIDCKFGIHNTELFGYDFVQDRVFRITTNNQLDEDADISPDNKQIVFVSERDKKRDLYTYNFESKEITQVTDSLNFLPELPIWSTSSSIFFSSKNGGGKIPNRIFELNLLTLEYSEFETHLEISSTPQFNKDKSMYFVYGRQKVSDPLEFHFHGAQDSTCTAYIFENVEHISEGKNFNWSGLD